jgi:hypothetical protein
MVSRTDSARVYFPEQKETQELRLQEQEPKPQESQDSRPLSTEEFCIHDILDQAVENAFNEFMDALKNKPGMGLSVTQCKPYNQKIKKAIRALAESHGLTLEQVMPRPSSKIKKKQRFPKLRFKSTS